MGVEITGKTMGVVGLGNVGRTVASRAKGLHMKVLAADPYIKHEAANELGAELVPLEELLARSDFITLHVPHMPETRKLICKDTIAKMKDGVRIINCARGEVLDVDDLSDALETGKVAGAALDVYPREPPDFSMPIFSHPNVIFTPHLGASTGEAQHKVAEMIAVQMCNYLVKGEITNAVNFPALPTEMIPRIRPYLVLAERMGALMGQMVRQPQKMAISYSGDVCAFDTHVLTHAVLKGFLGSFTDTPVNYVNAIALAESKGLEIEETKAKRAQDYTNLIRVVLPELDHELNEVWGTIFAKHYQRIVRVGSIYMDAIPEGNMLVIQNEDVPGVIGNVGTLLAKHNINIARFHLGRRDGRAICMVNIDSPADEAVLDDLRSLPHIIAVRGIQLQEA